MRQHAITIIIALLALTACNQTGNRTQRLHYTEEHPLVVLADKDFAPYEYLDEKGQSQGMHIELAEKVLGSIGVPYEIRHEEFAKLVTDFGNGQGDLIIDVAEEFEGSDIFYGAHTVNYYAMAFLTRTDSNDIHTLEQLSPNAIVGIKPRDYAMLHLEKKHFPMERVARSTPRYGLEAVLNGQYSYFLWGEQPLHSLVAKSKNKSLKVCHLDAPMPEIRFISHDQKLIDLIDHEYAELERSGYVRELRDRWLNGNKSSSRATMIYLAIGLVLLVIGILIFLNEMARKRIRRTQEEMKQMNDVMTSALGQRRLVTVFKAQEGRLYNVIGNLLPEKGLTQEEVVAHTHPDDVKAAIEGKSEVMDEATGTSRSSFRWNVGTKDEPRWINLRCYSLSERDKNGNTVNVFNTLYDMTEEVERLEKTKQKRIAFQQIYQQSILGQGFFQPDGTMTECNPRMVALLSRTFTKSELESFNLFDHPPVKGLIEPGHAEAIHLCHVFQTIDGTGEMALELRYFPAIVNDRLEFIGVTVVDITEQRDLYHEFAAKSKEVETKNGELSDYLTKFNHMIKSSNMTVWKSITKERRYIVSTDIRKMDHGMSFDDFGKLMMDDSIDTWNNNVIPILVGDSDEPINAVLHMRSNALIDKEEWMGVSGTPEYDSQGRKTGYFGISVNLTRQMQLRQQLKQEEQQAKESEHIKSVFLANMSHEIRTPLNSIVGFSELLESAETPEDKQNFVRIIQNNCDMLLRLINDILDLSAMDSNALVMKPEERDFSKAFDDICQSLEQRVTNPNVQFLTSNPYATFVTMLDVGRMLQVITNFVTNAIKYTTKGHIKVGYEYVTSPKSADREHGQKGLYIYCEDTGAGIPKEKCPSVFDRFVKLNDHVQGTGLGLSICRAIAERSGGDIGVVSDIGQGSTFWIWIPCEPSKVEGER